MKEETCDTTLITSGETNIEAMVSTNPSSYPQPPPPPPPPPSQPRIAPTTSLASSAIPFFPIPPVTFHSAPGAMAVGHFPNPGRNVTRINHAYLGALVFLWL